MKGPRAVYGADVDKTIFNFSALIVSQYILLV